MTKKWDLFDRYNEQQRKSGEAIARFYKRIAEAKENVVKARSEYEDLLRREALDGIDLTDEKAAARKALAEAQEAVEVAEKEAQEASRIISEASASQRIDVPALLLDWNYVYREEVRSQELQPIYDRIAEGREIILNALLDLYLLQDEYRPLEHEIKDLYHQYYRSRPGVSIFPNVLIPNTVAKMLTDADLRMVKSRKLPADIKRITSKKGRK